MNAGRRMQVGPGGTGRTRRWERAAAVALRAAMAAGLVLLAACGGGGGASAPPPPSEGSATIDAAGGEVQGPDGVTMAIPAGALATASTFRIARDGGGAPELGGAKAISPVYAITPHGTAFAESAHIRIPFNPADVAPGTQPMLMKAEPGGPWTALSSSVVGNTVSAADTPSLSYFAVGTCYTSRNVAIPGPDPLLYCPTAHTLTLTLQDGNGAALPAPRYPSGSLAPALTITAPQELVYTLQWTRPAGTQRSDLLNVTLQGAGLQPAQQPLPAFSTNGNFSQTFHTGIVPANVPGAGVAGGVVIRIRASATYTTDAFYPGCICFKPASWDFETEIPVRVVYSGSQPVITQQPQNQAVLEGQPASFSVTATGDRLTYTWFKSVLAVETPVGGNSASLTTGPMSLADNGALFHARVCSAAGTPTEQCLNTGPARLTVTQLPVAPVFTTQPLSISVIDGQTASLSVVATAQPAPTITWWQVLPPVRGIARSIEVASCPATPPGRGTTTASTCNLGALGLAQDGQSYFAQADNGASSVVASATVAVHVSPVPVAPAITSPAEPRDQTITTGASVTWTITASGTAPLNYLWVSVGPDGGRYGGIVCAGGSGPAVQANGATLTLVNVPQACDGYRFEATVSNGVLPNAVSRRALLTVAAPPAAPQIATPLAARSVLDGASVSFNVIATGMPSTFTYTWTLGGAAVPGVLSGCGAADSSCTFTARLADTGKAVAVSVANGVAPAASSSAVLTVTTADVPATITRQPAAQSVVVGGSATFTVGTSGTPTPDVVWQTLDTNNNNWVGTGSTGNSFTLGNLMLTQNGMQVRAIVSNAVAVPGGSQGYTVTSDAATLTVISNLPADALTGVQVVAYADRSLVLRADGSVVAFGQNTDVVTGGWSGSSLPMRPVVVAGLPATRQVDIGAYNNSWALGRDGTVWGWGFINSVKGFGQGPTNTRLEFTAPVQVLGAAGTPISQVCQVAGTLYGVVMVRSDVAGGTCAANEPRSVWFTGESISSNELGGHYATRFDRLAGNGTAGGLPQGQWIVEVFTSRGYGSNTSNVFARANDGSVYAWGYNADGLLGLGDTVSRTVPTLAPGWQGATRIAATGDVTLALMADGSIKGAGTNIAATLAIGDVRYDIKVTTPTVLQAPTGATDLSAASGQASAMALVGGQLRYWGSSTRFANAQQAVPIALAAPAAPLTALSVGGYHALAIGPGGAVYAWGSWNARGCGNYDSLNCSDTPVPTLVRLP
jgi:Regulator of chromosome condensation (RCC1) repeat/ZU5 domain